MTALSHTSLRLLIWLTIGAALHACAVLASWVLFRTVDLSSITPWAYSDHGWFLTITYYCFWVWLWMNE